MPIQFNQIRIAVGVAILGIACTRVQAAAADLEFFEKNVRPVLVDRCFKCHSAQAEKLKGGLLLDSREGLLKGGDDGPAIVPGAPEKSRLVEAISYSNVDLQMPPKGKLADEQIKALTEWVKMGAPWSTTEKSESKAVSSFDLRKRKSEHWAWQPLRKEAAPITQNDHWSKNEIDRFILAKLRGTGLSPAAPADKRVLIRRATFDLIGLPPTIAELDAFIADASPEAFGRMVDRLLASPQFGERWGRHWLDLVRYAETMGHEFDYPIPFAWRYRDYVIRAFNLDLPYKRFVTEHIAGDLIEPPRVDPATGCNESILGTSFFWFSQQSHSPVDIKAAQASLIENQIDVLGKAFLGMTVACARCHDHKFDAISAKDYYALYGVLESSRFTFAPVDAPAPARRVMEQLISLKRDLKEQIAEAWLDQAALLTNVAIPSRTIAEADYGKGGVLFADFSTDKSDGWFRTSTAFERIGVGELLLTGKSNQPVRLADRVALRSDTLSRKQQGACRSPTFIIDHDYIHVRAGGENSRINVVIDNFNLIRAPIYGGLKAALTSPTAKWISFDVKTWRGHRACIELADFVLADPADERSYGADGYLFAEKVCFSDEKDVPETKIAACDSEPAAERISGVQLSEIVRRWAGNTFSAKDAEILGGLSASSVLKLPDTEKFAKAMAEYAAAEKALPEPALAPVMAEGNGMDENLFIRGNPKTPGEKVERRFLEACGKAAPFREGSGRMELAEALTDPANPLPSRAAVNWAWHHLFGRGLVASVDNFGVLGERPSHPELLDWLALRFQEQGGPFKKLIREMMLSATYQMSSAAGDKAIEEKDPDNVLLHRARVRRLEAEAIRDSMLAISGSLNPAQFGPPVPVYLTAFMDGRGKPAASGPLDGAGRRTVYLEVRRNSLNPMMLAFDYPMPSSTMGRRSESNVPAQALTLLNDPFIINQAENWAKASFKKHSGLTPEERIRNFYLTAFARTPEPGETADALAFLAEQEKLNGSGEATEKSWTDLCHVLFNVKEFIFLN